MKVRKNYSKAVRDCVNKEFQAFKKEEISKSVENIFDDCYMIHFYKEMQNYLCYSVEDVDGLEKIHYQALYTERGNIISSLYDYYIKYESASINTWGEIHDMIRAYNQRYHKKIVQGGMEIE